MENRKRYGSEEDRNRKFGTEKKPEGENLE
jgi:hypothetical protein